jgi:hypothetical protein
VRWFATPPILDQVLVASDSRGDLGSSACVSRQRPVRQVAASELDVDRPTGAMRDLYAHHGVDMAGARRALAAQPGRVGALIYVDKRWVELDLVAGLGLFGRVWPCLCAAM